MGGRGNPTITVWVVADVQCAVRPGGLLLEVDIRHVLPGLHGLVDALLLLGSETLVNRVTHVDFRIAITVVKTQVSPRELFGRLVRCVRRFIAKSCSKQTGVLFRQVIQRWGSTQVDIVHWRGAFRFSKESRIKPIRRSSHHERRPTVR